MRVFLGTRRDGFEVSTDLSAEVERAIVAAGGATLALVTDQVDEVLRHARERWPRPTVDVSQWKSRTLQVIKRRQAGDPHPYSTGRSFQGLGRYLRVSGDRTVVEAGVRNEQRYAMYIRTAGMSPWAALVVRPVNAAGRQLARRLADELERTTRRAVGEG